MLKKDSKSPGKGDENASNSINLIGTGTAIKGDVSTDNDIRIDGTVEGNISTSSKIVLGEQAKIVGDVYCGAGDLSGKIEGNIYSKDLLHLKASSRINGNVYTKRLVVEKDALFNGQCEMKEQVSFEKPASKGGDQSFESKSTEDNSGNQANEKGQTQQTPKKPSV